MRLVGKVPDTENVLHDLQPTLMVWFWVIMFG